MMRVIIKAYAAVRMPKFCYKLKYKYVQLITIFISYIIFKIITGIKCFKINYKIILFMMVCNHNINMSHYLMNVL